MIENKVLNVLNKQLLQRFFFQKWCEMHEVYEFWVPIKGDKK